MLRAPESVRQQWGEFLTPVDVRWLRERGGDRRMMTLAPVRFRRANGQLIVVDADFIFDGASIPRALWSLVGSPFTGDYRDGALVHDWLCRYGRSLGYAAPEVHHVLYECAKALQCHPLRASLIYHAVAVAGPHRLP